MKADQTQHDAGHTNTSQLELQQTFYCELQSHAQASKSGIFPLCAGWGHRSSKKQFNNSIVTEECKVLS